MRRTLASLLIVSMSTIFAGEYVPPALPEGLEAKVIASAPTVSDVTSVSASPDGRRVYVANQPSACDRGKWGEIKVFIDADGDGTYEKNTVFANEIGGGQGMVCVGDTIYVVHSPYLTKLRDSDGDGVADERKNLIEGLGPQFNGGLHDHTCSGLALGTDGWFYISIGDKGIHKATGTDGRIVQLNGGGILRVRPDGTEMEVVCVGLRNTMDVAIDPELNIFMRDNTNDGGGWNVRSTHIWPSGQYGYPNLYKNYVDEMLPALADHGGGSPCGAIFYNEAGLREEDRGQLLFCDWGRAVVYRYELKRKGATYEMQQLDWIKAQAPFRAIDIQPDALGNLYLADWARGGWGKGLMAGAVMKINTKGFTPTVKIPDFKNATIPDLIAVFSGPSNTLKQLAQHELIARGDTASSALLTAMNAGDATPKLARIYALWTYKQIAKGNANKALLDLAASRPDLREHALRAATDRKKELNDVTSAALAKYLKDENAFVRGIAALGLGRLGTPPDAWTTGSENFTSAGAIKRGQTVANSAEIAKALCEALGDAEPQVRHVAMRALRGMEAFAACLETAEKGTSPARETALLALREIYQDAAADGLIALYKKETDPVKKGDIVKTLGRLAKKEDEWAGNWWGTQPNTVGPFQKPVAWSSTDKLAAAVKSALADPSEEVAVAALVALSCMRDETAAAELGKLVSDPRAKVKESAIATLIATRPAGSAPQLLKLALDTTLSDDQRKAVIDTMTRAKGGEFDQAIAELTPKLDAEYKDKKFDKNSGVLPTARKALGNVRAKEAIPALKAAVSDAALPNETRAAAARALSGSNSKEASEALTALLKDPNPELVALALKNVEPKSAVKPAQIRDYMKHADRTVQAAAMIALGKLKDVESAEKIAMQLKTSGLQLPAIEALKAMGPVGGEVGITDVIERLIAIFEADEFEDQKAEEAGMATARLWIAAPELKEETRKKLRERTAAGNGVVDFWRVQGPFLVGGEKAFETVYDVETAKPAEIASVSMRDGHDARKWQPAQVEDPQGRMAFHTIFGTSDNGAAFAFAEFAAEKEGKATLLMGSDDSLSVWLNGTRVFHKDNNRGWEAEKDKIPVTLKAGNNVLLVKVCNHGGGWELSCKIEGLTAKRKTGKRAQAREALVAMALEKTGDAKKGQAIFNDEKRAGCIRCHKVNSTGGAIGPDLSSIGATKEKRYLIDSVLEPSKDMAQGFIPMRITLNSGKVLLGAILSQSADGFELAMADGNREPIKEADVKSKVEIKTSIMPEGLADQLTRDEFIDLVTYLVSLKK